MNLIKNIFDLIKAGFGGYVGWGENEALQDFKATGGVGKKTSDPIDDFFRKYENKFVDYDKSFGCQCVDLIRQFVKEIYKVNPYTAIPTTGWAKNIFLNFKENQYFKKILNTPSNIPQKGDIIFWTNYPLLYGKEGHTSIVKEADLYSIISFDQNYPTGSPCRFVKHGTNKLYHGYRGCLGWLRKK